MNGILRTSVSSCLFWLQHTATAAPLLLLWIYESEGRGINGGTRVDSGACCSPLWTNNLFMSSQNIFYLVDPHHNHETRTTIIHRPHKLHIANDRRKYWLMLDNEGNYTSPLSESLTTLWWSLCPDSHPFPVAVACTWPPLIRWWSSCVFLWIKLQSFISTSSSPTFLDCCAIHITYQVRMTMKNTLRGLEFMQNIC